jgi:hypothetical protein
VHWSNSGHGKAADIMTDCLSHLIDSQAMMCSEAILSENRDTDP